MSWSNIASMCNSFSFRMHFPRYRFQISWLYFRKTNRILRHDIINIPNRSICGCNIEAIVNPQVRRFSSNNNNDGSDHDSAMMNIRGVVSSRYKIFKDYDSPVILDVDEERQLLRENPDALLEVRHVADPFIGLNVDRGETGVFDIEEFVDVLKQEMAFDIVTLSIHPKFQYVDYMVIATGKNQKHLKTLAEYMNKLYKRKRHETDPFVTIEGKENDSWKAIDFGNIVLHLFDKKTRKTYDLETLWAVGPHYDDLTNEKDDEYVTLLKQHTHPALADLEPQSEDFETGKDEISGNLLLH